MKTKSTSLSIKGALAFTEIEGTAEERSVYNSTIWKRSFKRDKGFPVLSFDIDLECPSEILRTHKESPSGTQPNYFYIRQSLTPGTSVEERDPFIPSIYMARFTLY